MTTHRVPDWAKDAVFYQIFPERFENGDRSNDPPNTEAWGKSPKGNNFFGGDLQGIINRMDHLKRLGINALYLNPIFQATTNHKYNTTDYSVIDPSFGTNELFDRFTELCRKNGIRIVLDGVFNHVGTAHFAFQDVVKNGASSPYAPWFNVYSYPVRTHGKPNYECWWGIASLPKLMTQHPAVKKYLFEEIARWTPKIDGWRLDVANEVPHEFWKEFRTLVRSINPECYIVGELWEDASPWLHGDEFDATMNYRFRAACLDFFANDKTNAAEFDKHLLDTRNSYPPEHNFVMQNLLGSHDTERYRTLCRLDDWRVALSVIFQMTYVGAPMVYYGDEIGMEGGKDPDCRRTMIWDESRWHRSHFDLHQKLIAFRHSSAALRRGDFTTLVASSKKDLYAFQRSYQQETVVVVLNKHASKSELRLPVPMKNGSVTELLSGSQHPVAGGTLHTTIPARSGAIFKFS